MLYPLPSLQTGTFLKRENRFLAFILSQNQEKIPIHVANSGRMKELLTAGVKVWWQPKNTPKTKGLLWAVENNGVLVVLSAVTANHIAEAAFKKKELSPLQHYDFIQKEKTFQKSRFDFLLKNNQSQKLVLAEVKSVNLCQKGVGLFPDAPTTRGVKHLEELLEATKQGYEALVFFVGLREDIKQISPHTAMDPNFTKALKKCQKGGVSILACHSTWNLQGCQNLVFVPFQF